MKSEPKEEDASLKKAEKVIDSSDKLTVNMPYVIAYTTVYGIGTFQCAWCISGNSQTTKVFEAKLGWDKDETILYNTIISSSAIIGLAIGCIFGGGLLTRGRRKMAFYAHLIAIIASGICMFDTVLFLTLGRFVLGFAAGICNLIYSKSITENFPEKLAATLAMMCNASICIGIFTCFVLGGILPDPDDLEANKDDQLWRVIYGMPAAIGVFSILILLFVFR